MVLDELKYINTWRFLMKRIFIALVALSFTFNTFAAEQNRCKKKDRKNYKLCLAHEEFKDISDDLMRILERKDEFNLADRVERVSDIAKNNYKFQKKHKKKLTKRQLKKARNSRENLKDANKKVLKKDHIINEYGKKLKRTYKDYRDCYRDFLKILNRTIKSKKNKNQITI